MADEQIVTSIVAKADLSSLVSEVHRATASLQQLQRELLTSNKSIAAATKVAQNAFRDTLTKSGMYSSHFVNLQSDIDTFGKNLDAGRLKLRDYFSTYRTHIKSTGGMIRELAREQVMLQNAVLQPLGRNAQGLMQYNVMIPRGLDAVASKTKLANMEAMIMNRTLSQGATSLINWGKNTQWAGRQLTVGLTVPITMFGAAASKAFREADQELTRLVKVYGDLSGTASQDLQKIRQDVTKTAKELSSAMGVSFKETIGLAADIAATGQQGEQLLSSLRETTRLAVLGEVDRAEAMKATLAIQTAFKSNTEELTKTINFLNAVENQTSTTLNDLVEAIPKAGTVVKQLGGDVQDLALYLTAMREGGVNASEAANALKSGLASMINPTKQTIGLLSDFGIDILGMVERNAGNTTGMILDLQKALDAIDPLSKARALEQLFGKFQFARMAALFNNLGKEGSQTLKVMELMNASAAQLSDVAGRELSLVTESASGKYRRAIEGLRASLADVGEDFLGIATKFINAFTKVLDFFTNLPEPIKKALTYLGGFTAVIGPIIMLTGVMANFFGYITKGLVSLKAFFQGTRGWKMLTPEMIAAEKAAQLVEKGFYSDAAAAEVLHGALQKLITDYRTLQQSMTTGTMPVNPSVTTQAGNLIMGRRVVDPTNPYVGEENTRAMSHIIPRDPARPASIFGGVPGAIPVNQAIGRNFQMYMDDTLPHVEGITSIRGVSTGIVSTEAARFHALMGTLGMQTEQEVASLKKTIALGGTVSSQLLDTFDDILPITTRLSQNAATQSSAIVAELRAGKITVDQAKAQILAVNAQLEQALMSEVGAYAASRGRTIDFYKAPLMNQPVVDATGQFTLRDLFKKEANRGVMEEFGRLRGVRTFGAPYSIHTTRIPRFYDGGSIESFGPNKTEVSGPSSINYDDRLGSIPLNGYVLNQSASMDPANKDLKALAPLTFNNGGSIVAALTPKETIFGPNLHKIPGLYDALENANNGYNFGGQIKNGIYNYGQKITETPAYYKKQLGELVKFMNSPSYEDSIRFRMVMLDAAELIEYGKIPASKAIEQAYANFNEAKLKSNGSTSEFIKNRIKQVKDLEKKYPALKRLDSSGTRFANSKALNKHVYRLKKLMESDPRFENVRDEIKNMVVFDRNVKSKAKVPYIQQRDERGVKVGLARGHMLRHGDVGYATRGHMGVAAVIDSELNSLMNRLDQIGLRKDIIHLTSSEAKDSLAELIKKAGMKNMATVDDIAIALSDTSRKFPSKAELEEIKSGKRVLATPQQKNSLKMLLEAITKRKRWVMVPKGRPPIMTPVLASFNMGGSIPGGSISRLRSSYGNTMPLLSPSSMLKILSHSKQMSSRKALGSFAKMPVANYSHMLAPSTGKSFPIPGVSGLYKNEFGEKVFFKGVPNEIAALGEFYGTQIARMFPNIIAPTQTIRTIRNPLDPTGKTKLLGLESPFDPRFINPNVKSASKYTTDEAISQLALSLLFNNKDLSRSNVFRNVNVDVGNAGVFSRASNNTAFSNSMHSMEQQALINLLAVRGGARKDFTHDTSSIISKISPRQYNAKMKKVLRHVRPQLIDFVSKMPKEHQAPYLKMIERLDEGLNVNWAKYHTMHSAPKYNRGGIIGGGRIVSGRTSYGKREQRKDAQRRYRIQQEQEANRARNEENRRLRAQGVEPQPKPTGYITPVTGTKQAIPNFANAPTNYYSGFLNSGGRMVSRVLGMAKMPQMNFSQMNIPFLGNTSAIIHSISQLPAATKAAMKNFATTMKEGATALGHSALYGAKYTAASFKSASVALANGMKSYVTDSAAIARRAWDNTTQILRRGATHDFAKMGYFNATPSMLPPHLQHLAGAKNSLQRYIGPIGLTAWAPQVGADGSSRMHDGKEVLSRKTGPLGFRQEQYALRDASGNVTNLSKAEARAAGIARAGAMSRLGATLQNGRFGMGAGGMGTMMAGSMAGSALMMQGKTGLGMGVMLGSSMLPMMLPQIAKGMSKVSAAVAASKSAFSAANASSGAFAKTLNILRTVFSRALFVGPLIGITALVTAFAVLIKKTREWQKDAQLRFGMTAEAAKQAGIEYTSLADKLKLIAQRQAALRNAALRGSGGGIIGLNMSMEELKKAKEFAKENLKEFIPSFDRASKENIGDLAANIKAQFVAAGMSVEEANKKIMGIIAASKNAALAVNVIADVGFSSIKDEASAAEFSVKRLNEVLQSGNQFSDQYRTKVIEGMSSVVDMMDAAVLAASKQKDSMGRIKGEAEALNEILRRMRKNSGFDDAIGLEAFNQLPIELQVIADKTDSIAGIYAKWRLYLKGVQLDLRSISSETAEALDKYLTGFTAAMDKLEELGRTGNGAASTINNTFGAVGFALSKLQKIIDANNRENLKAAAAAQRASEDQNKTIEERIALINKEADAKLKALEATQARENYEIEIQRARLEYQNAIARGDMAAAAKAQLDITQLTKQYQLEQARKAIEEERAKREAVERNRQKKLQEEESARQRKIQEASEKAADAQEAMSKIQSFSQQYKDLLLQRETNQYITDESERGVADRQTSNAIKSLVSLIQKDALKTGFMGEQIKLAFSQFFDKSGKPLQFESNTFDTVYNKKENRFDLVNRFNPGQMANVLNRDLQAARAQALLITGGMTIKELAESISKDLGQGKGGEGGGRDSKMNPSYYATAGYNNTGLSDPNAPKGGTLVSQKGKTYIYSNDGVPVDTSTPLGKKLLEILNVDVKKVKPIQLFDGGPIHGPGTSTSDSIPAMLSNGEYVINADSAQKIGYDTLDRINKYKDGGRVGYKDGGKAGEFRTEAVGGYDKIVDYFNAIGDLTVNFATGKSTLSDDQIRELRSIARKIRLSGASEMQVKGYADLRGSSQSNLRLSEERAKYVADLLSSIVDSVKFTSRGIGELPSNMEAEALSRSRKVYIEVPDRYIKPNPTPTPVTTRPPSGITGVPGGSWGKGRIEGPKGGSSSGSIGTIGSMGTGKIEGQKGKISKGSIGLGVPKYADGGIVGFKDGGIVGYADGGRAKKKKVFGIDVIPGSLSGMLAVAEKAVGYINRGTSNPLFRSLTSAIGSALPDFRLWCGRFINWVGNLVGVKLPNVTGTWAGYDSFKKKGRLFQNPMPGDIAFFDFERNKNYTDHVGIVSKVLSKNAIRTIEGNTRGSSGKGQTTGGMVAIKNRPYGQYNPQLGVYTRGFGRPFYVKETIKKKKDFNPHNLAISPLAPPTMGTPDPNQSFLNKILFGTKYVGGNMKLLKGEVPFGPGSTGKILSHGSELEKYLSAGIKEWDLKMTTGTLGMPGFASSKSLKDFLSSKLYHGGNLGELTNKSRGWFGASLYATDKPHIASVYGLAEKAENIKKGTGSSGSLYQIFPDLNIDDVIDLRHNAPTIFDQNPKAYEALLEAAKNWRLKIIDSGDPERLGLLESFLKAVILEGRSGTPMTEGLSRIHPLLRFNLAKTFREIGIKGIVNRGGWWGSPTIAGKAQTMLDPMKHAGYDILSLLDVTGTKFRSLTNFSNIPKFATGGYVNAAKINIPSFDTGTRFLYSDTIAQLHAREAVLPPDMNPWNPTATNPIGGNTYYIQPTINAGPGMDESILAKLAAREVVSAMSKMQIQVGQSKLAQLDKSMVGRVAL